MNVIYPTGTTTASNKTAFLYRVQEKLRLAHNVQGKKYTNKEITKAQWESYLETWDKKNDATVEEILKERSKLKNDTSWNISLNAAFKE